MGDADELERIVLESAVDAAHALGAPVTRFTMHDLERFRTIELKSFAEVTETVRRIIAMRTWGGTAGTARLDALRATARGCAPRVASRCRSRAPAPR